ncbi:hypothetical protein [Asticcacaulis endophyticus]|uniref:hypothetical protein n=1 Tax=Asticcacaulis endophyticus TaxID=1395890 RepID=UPI0016720A60|nr:hypothetical protein [Asticcacaulis endophyticus]
MMETLLWIFGATILYVITSTFAAILSKPYELFRINGPQSLPKQWKKIGAWTLGGLRGYVFSLQLFPVTISPAMSRFLRFGLWINRGLVVISLAAHAIAMWYMFT